MLRRKQRLIPKQKNSVRPTRRQKKNAMILPWQKRRQKPTPHSVPAVKTRQHRFSGENALDYRKRALIAMQKHSPAHKDVNIRAIADSATLAVLEDAIFSAARQSIEKEMMSTQGQLHKRIRN